MHEASFSVWQKALWILVTQLSVKRYQRLLGSCEARIQFNQAGYPALRTYPKAKGKKGVTETTVAGTRFSSSIWTYLLFKK